MSEYSDIYQELILDHQKNPRNFGELAGANRHAEGFNPLCGDKVLLDLKVNAEGVIEDIRFKGSGCAISKASASMMTVALKGKKTEEAQALFRLFHGLVTGQEETKGAPGGVAAGAPGGVAAGAPGGVAAGAPGGVAAGAPGGVAAGAPGGVAAGAPGGVAAGAPGGVAAGADLGKLKVFAGVKEYPARVKCASLAWHTLQAALLKETNTITTDDGMAP